MKNLRTITTLKAIAIIVVIAVFSSCENKNLNPSSNVTVQDRTIEDYTGIEISTVFIVDVTISDTEEKIEIEANENLHAYIDVIKSGNDLLIKVKDNTSIQGKATLKAHITTSNPLNKISVRDASSLIMKNALETNHILLLADDASMMSAQVNTVTAEVRVEDASDIVLSGTCGSMQLYAYDASDLNGLDMMVSDVVARMDGASRANLTVNKTIDLAAKDASVFSYKGDAVITDIDLKDASQIIKLD